jgi:hypothetical protein
VGHGAVQVRCRLAYLVGQNKNIFQGIQTGFVARCQFSGAVADDDIRSSCLLH